MPSTIPENFRQYIDRMGSPLLAGLAEALATEPVTSLRVNRAKGYALPADARRVPWEPDGCYLSRRPCFTLDPALHQGAYYVQDASSMFLGHVLRHITVTGQPVAYLDACAAPGGKTTSAIAVLPEGSAVVANEFVASRAAVLRENLVKWGYPFCRVTQGDTARFSSHLATFDIVAADVPCSGEGMMRKDEQAAEQWSEQLVARCAERQREIVNRLWPALRPGGYFIYSTCTFNREENEEMVRWIIDTYGARSVEIPVDPAWKVAPGIGTPHHCYRFIPGRTEGEGLFMAVMQRPSSDVVKASGPRRKPARGCPEKPHPAFREVAQWIDVPVRLTLDGDRIVAWPRPAVTMPEELQPYFEAATVKGKSVIPSHALAMSSLLRRGVFPEVELNRADAIAYLRREAPSLGDEAPRGMVLLTYRGTPLGFAKNLGNRANNLYPAEWRILAQPLPGTVLPPDVSLVKEA